MQRTLAAFGVTFFLVVLQDSAGSHFLGPFSVTTTFASRFEDVFVLALFLWADAFQVLAIGHKNEAVIVRSQSRRSPPFVQGLRARRLRRLGTAIPCHSCFLERGYTRRVRPRADPP